MEYFGMYSVLCNSKHQHSSPALYLDISIHSVSQLCLQQQEEHRVTSTSLCFTFSVGFICLFVLDNRLLASGRRRPVRALRQAR